MFWFNGAIRRGSCGRLLYGLRGGGVGVDILALLGVSLCHLAANSGSLVVMVGNFDGILSCTISTSLIPSISD